ncbi:hypothetical protein ACTXT7_003378 [Hymenolepis weldensis]
MRPSLIVKEPDVKKSRCGPESAAGPLTAKAVPLKMLILWRTSLSSRLPYRRHRCQNCNEGDHKEGLCRIFYEQFNEAEPEQESINLDKTELWQVNAALMVYHLSYRSTLGPIMLCNSTYRCKAIYLEKCNVLGNLIIDYGTP